MATPRLFIRLTHTGLHADGRVNTNPVYVQDLDVGYEYQHRKVKVYVPAGGFIDITASSRSMLSYESGFIAQAVDAGLLTAKMFLQPDTFSNGTRPAASGYPVGAMVWNTDDNAPNFSDGTNWRDASGGLT